MSENLTPSAEAYEKTLAIVKEQFRIAATFSQGNRASWLQEVENLLNSAIANHAQEQIHQSESR